MAPVHSLTPQGISAWMSDSIVLPIFVLSINGMIQSKVFGVWRIFPQNTLRLCHIFVCDCSFLILAAFYEYITINLSILLVLLLPVRATAPTTDINILVHVFWFTYMHTFLLGVHALGHRGDILSALWSPAS